LYGRKRRRRVPDRLKRRGKFCAQYKGTEIGIRSRGLCHDDRALAGNSSECPTRLPAMGCQRFCCDQEESAPTEVPLEVCNFVGTLVYNYVAPAPAPAWHHTKSNRLGQWGRIRPSLPDDTKRDSAGILLYTITKLRYNTQILVLPRFQNGHLLTLGVLLCFVSILADNLLAYSCRCE
jgi:hypothetical protein